MKVEAFVGALHSDFYTGVPDSQLKALCDYLVDYYGNSSNHMIAANEGNAVGLATGYYLSTGKIPVIYMQNSGIGNAINPIMSLTSTDVYGIPCIYVIGWRGEPGVHDEPQHVHQGKVTLQLLENIGIESFVVSKETTEEELEGIARRFSTILANGKSVAYVIKKGGLQYEGTTVYKNTYELKREKILECIVNYAVDDIIVSTTGKISRELFEIRERNRQDHSHDFLTVGSMGHSSSIALKIALEHPEKKVWCIDGDGAALMHMGSMAIIGNKKPSNLKHIIINNEAHETVGGMPTAGNSVDFVKVAEACGYCQTMSIEKAEVLDDGIKKIKHCEELALLEIKCSIGSRVDLGRPTTTPEQNKVAFMKFLKK